MYSAVQKIKYGILLLLTRSPNSHSFECSPFQENEYEILMLLMADMRERLQSYENQTEDELRLLNTRVRTPEAFFIRQLLIRVCNAA